MENKKDRKGKTRKTPQICKTRTKLELDLIITERMRNY